VPRRKRLTLIIAAMVSSLVLAIAPVATQGTPVQAADPTWTKYTGDVSLDTELYVTDAWVIKDDSTYKMWYTHGKTDLTIADLRDELGNLNLDEIIDDLANQDLEELLNDLAALNASDVLDFLNATTTVIGYATSNDSVTWTIQDSEVLAGSSTGLWSSVGLPCVIKDGSTYKMWYTSGETDLTRTTLQNILDDLNGNAEARKTAILDLLDSMHTVIGYATSNDGQNWTIQDAEVLAGDGNWFNSVADPSVIKDDSTYRMWYTQGKTDLDRDDLGNVLTDTADFDIDTMMDLLDGTSTVIGYATSANGTTWTVQNAEALAGNPGGLWESVADPSVIKTNSTYEMWYTNVTTNLDRSGLSNILGEIQDLDIPAFLDTIASGDLTGFLDELATLDVTDLKALLNNTSTQIGYATSSDGSTWTVQDADDLTGSSSNIWSSVGAPSIVKLNSSYKMWYTQGIDDLTVGNLLDILQGTNLSLGYAYYSPSAPAPGGVVPEDYVDMDPDDAADELGDMDPDDAADILDEIDPDDAADILGEMVSDTAADILEEMVSDDAADILDDMVSNDAADIMEEMVSDAAADILEEMVSDDAVDIMENMNTDPLEGIIPNMSVPTLTDTLPGLTPDTLYDINPQVLFDALSIDGILQVPTEQLLSEDPPTPPPGATPPVVVYTTPSGARYLAVRTWAGEWVVAMGTPEPIDQLMIKTKQALENVETILEVFDERPQEITVELPTGQIAMAYFSIDFENAAPEDIELGHITFKVEQDWLEENSIHKWSVVLSRYNPELEQWIALPTKRVDEDSSHVYYTSPITHFSTFAISGSEDIPAVNFSVSNLTINPTDAKTEQDVTVTADITNLSNQAETYVATLWIDNTLETAQDVSIDPNQTKAVLFTVTRDVAGSYEVRLDRFFESFNVTEAVKAPAAFATSNLTITPAEINAGDEVTISMLVTNTGDLSGSYEVTLKIDAVVVETRQIVLNGGASGMVTFTTTRDVAGTYSVTIDGLTGTFKVKEVAPPPEAVRWWRIAVIITAVTIAIVVPLVIRRRRMMA